MLTRPANTEVKSTPPTPSCVVPTQAQHGPEKYPPPPLSPLWQHTNPQILCCVVLCCVVLCCVVLCCVVLCCVVLCCVVLRCVVLCCVVLCCFVLCLQWRHAKVVQQLLDHLCTYDILYPKTAGSVIRSNPRVLMQHDTGTYKPTDCPQNTPTLGHTIFLLPPNRVPDERVQGAKQKYFQTAPSPRPQTPT